MPFIANKKAYAIARFGKWYYKGGVFVPEETITDWGHMEYFKYASWSQPVNPSGITASSGWGNVANAFDKSASTYATCGTSTDYIEWNLGAEVLLKGITAKGQYADSVARACNLIVKSVNSSGKETTLGTTTGATKASTYNLSVSFSEVQVNKLRFYLTAGDNGNAPTTSYKSRIREITLTATQQVIETTAEDDYDYSVFVPSTQFDSYREGIRYYDPVSSLSERKTVLVTSATSLQQFVVPVGVTSLEVTCIGSAGKAATGAAGKGGRVTCNLSVTPGEVLYLTVGSVPSAYNTPAYNASDIRIGGTAYANRVIVAGGGGSGASANGAGAGGNGGGTTGAAGATSRCCGGGQGGTQTAGGAGGVGISWTTQQTRNGSAGTLGLGGKITAHSGAGGAGGAGYYGGGGGCSGFTKSYGTYGGGGGGGSSYANSSRCTNVSHAQGVCSGTGSIKLSYIQKKELVE